MSTASEHHEKVSGLEQRLLGGAAAPEGAAAEAHAALEEKLAAIQGSHTALVRSMIDELALWQCAQALSPE